ncbi:MAG: TIGR00180 family glycosyltransferase [Nitrospirae bacterium]|nr:TIGR00180 family glycosyltransferase [Nitrospirota bacterium]MBI3378834.1 TIGR00180 family glycosyltransferase [Nitrospirota bacterium]
MITLAIPTLNRSDFLTKVLNYYADTGYKHQIIIGDSSDDFHSEKLKISINELRHRLNIVYRWYSPDISVVKCLDSMLKDVITPYASVVGDDDFLVPNGLEKCIGFLEAHEDYTGAHGVGARIFVSQSRSQLQVDGVYDYTLSPREEETASERLIRHMSNMSNRIFSVYRTNVLRKMFENVELPDHAIASDLLPGCLSVVQGKTRKLDSFHMVHLVHTGQYMRHKDIYDWLTGPNWFPSYKLFSSILSEEVSKKDNIALDDSRLVVKQALWAYLNYKFNNHFKNRYTVLTTKEKIKKRFPLLKKILDKARDKRDGIFPSSRTTLSALSNPSSPYHDDFMPIYRSVLKKR